MSKLKKFDNKEFVPKMKTLNEKVEHILTVHADDPAINCLWDNATKLDLVEFLRGIIQEVFATETDKEKEIILKEVVKVYSAYDMCGITTYAEDSVSQGDYIDVVEEDFNNEYAFDSLETLDDDCEIFDGSISDVQDCFDTRVKVSRLLRGKDILVSGTKWNDWEEDNDNGLKAYYQDDIFVVYHFQQGVI